MEASSEERDRTSWWHRPKHATGPSNCLEAEVIFRLKTWTRARGRWRMNADGQWWCNVVQRTIEFTSGGSSHFLRTCQGQRVWTLVGGRLDAGGRTFGRWWVNVWTLVNGTNGTNGALEQLTTDWLLRKLSTAALFAVITA